MPPRLDLVWRTARPLLSGVSRLCRPASRSTSSAALPSSTPSSTSTPETSTLTTPSSSSPLPPPPPPPSVVSWTTLARDEETRRQQQRESSPATASEAPSSPGAVLIESLERDPLVPLPSSLPPSSSSSSVLVEPAVQYRHPNETYRSGLLHRLSLLRQSRLEIIRQAQKWPLPDWRDILRRLVAYTPRGADHVGRGQLHLLQTPSPLPQLDAFFAASSREDLTVPSSSSHWYTDAVSFRFSGDSLSVHELLYGIDNSLWAIRGRTGCVLKMFRRRPSAKNARATQENPVLGALDADRPWMLTLSGTELSIRQATAEVMRLAKDAVPMVGEAGPETVEAEAEAEAVEAEAKEAEAADAESVPAAPLPAVYVWSLELTSHFRHNAKIRDDPVFRPYVLRHSAYDIPRPPVWTRDSFERYVASLVNGRLAPHLASDLYSDNEPKQNEGEGDLETAYAGPPSHDRAVIDILHRIFHEPAARAALSMSAFKMALEFMCRRGEAHRPDARALFVRMEMAGLPMDTATFNILLESQVKSQDLRNFGTTLLLMHGRGHAPNVETWELFLRIFASADVKRHILRAMYARGLLDQAAAVRRVAGEMAHHDTEQALRVAERGVRSHSGRAFSLDRFLVHMAARYGDGWLGLSAANRVLGVLATHGRFPDCARLLQHMPRSPAEAQHQRLQVQHAAAHFRYQPPLPTVATQPPDVVSFNIVLTHCKEQRSLANALPFVHLMDALRVAPDPITYQLLFRTAWLRRLPHVLGVLWHYACAAGLDNYWVRRRVSDFMRTAHARPDRAPLRHVLSAGVTLPETTSVDDTTTTTSSSSSPSSPRRTPPHAGILISRELGKRYAGLEPIVPLGEALQDALARDNEALQSRYTNAASSSPLRIPLRRIKGSAAADMPNEQPEYMEICVPPLRRRGKTQSP